MTISERNCPISDTMIYDVSALLWVITWPSGKLRVYVDAFKEQIEDKTTSLLVQIDNRIRISVMSQIMMLNISSPVYVITKISAIISRYLRAKFEQ